ncbi:MAG: hypothetical protein KJO24_01515 [Gammaproteobacteria bacterium]|nr:hypothetical protein [Gammaproteobacteria bacterium]
MRQDAADFGKQLFFDPTLSGASNVSCASCHQPDKAFTDGLATGKGVGKLPRNTPSAIGLSDSSWFYWDGRKDSLWSQALAPIEAGAEMNSSRLQVVRAIGTNLNYRRQYQAIFGSYPLQLLATQWSRPASPIGAAARQENWYRMPAPLREQVNRVFANIGKALAAYEHTLQYSDSRFDRYARELSGRDYARAESLLSKDELAGLALFIDSSKTQCLNCHNGPAFSNRDFHNIGSGRLQGAQLDFGRFLGVQSVLLDEFNCSGRYSDAPAGGCDHLRFINKQVDDHLRGAYKTPSLRNLVLTAPYFHDGRFDSLEQVLDYYLSEENQLAANRNSELLPLQLSSDEQRQLLAFLRSLTSHSLPADKQAQ